MLATWGCTTFPKPTLSLDFLGATSLDSGITFSRGSQATLFDSTGTLVYAKHNLLLQSEDFSTTWVATGATVTANAIVAPSGATTGDKMIVNNAVSSSSSSLRQEVTKAASAITYTLSMFAKKDEADTLRLIPRDTATSANNADARFNLDDGTVISVTAAGTFTNASAAIQNAGNGWYRCSVTFTSGTETSIRNQIFQQKAGANFTGNGTDGIFIWGAQLNQNPMEGGVTSSLTTYYPTTTAAYYAPRFDYNPSTLQPRGLLIEEARTNSVLRSQEFDDPYFTKVRTSITANAIVAPDGTLTADKLVENTDTNTHLMSSTNITAVIGTVYTYSIFAKAGERNLVAIGDGTGGSIGAAIFDLSAGTVTFFQAGGSATITAVGNGWYRCTYTTLAAVDTTINFTVYMTNSTTTVAPSYTGNGTSGFFIWGAQLEAGAFATSYIPTTTTALTRNADIASMTGTNFSSWYNASEGTIYGQSVIARQPAATANILAISDGTADNFIDLRYRATGTVGAQVVTLTAVQVNNTTGPTATANLLIKDCFAFAVNNAAESINGLTPIIDLSISVPTVNRMFIGANPNGNASFLNGHIQRVAYYPTRLPNATLQALTA